MSIVSLRTLALKALNERLSKVQQSENVSDSEWPSLEQEEGSVSPGDVTKGTLTIDSSQPPARTHGVTVDPAVDQSEPQAKLGDSNSDTANKPPDAS